jgi:AraC-like DNA-binding protein
VHDLKLKRLGAIPTAAGVVARLAYERTRAARIEVEPLLKKAGLTKQQVDDVDARLGAPSQIKFLNLVASALQDEFLGFHLAQQVAELRKLGLLYYIMASSGTLGEALRRLARYVSVVNESTSVKYLEGKDIRIVINYIGVARHSDQHQIECWLTALIRVCRKLTDYPIKPRRVRLIHRRASKVSELAAFFGCDVEFGAAADDVVFPLSIADVPIVSADPYLNRLLVANCEDALSRRSTKRPPFRVVVENAIGLLLPHGNVRESEIASRCGMSRRTFVRRLMAESLTFEQVLKDLRRDLATQYLSDDGVSISQIAWLLGYQGAGAFTNAFKHWTGQTPRQVRFELHRP